MALIKPGEKIVVEVMGTYRDEPEWGGKMGDVYLLQVSIDLDMDASYQVYITRPESEPRGIVVLQRFDDRFLHELEKDIKVYEVVS